MRAAPRDASWYRNPNTSGARVVHAEAVGEDLFAACSRWILLSEAVLWQDSTEVPRDLRCRRRACQRRYLEADWQAASLEQLARAFGSRTGGRPSFTAEAEGDEYLFGAARTSSRQVDLLGLTSSRDEHGAECDCLECNPQR